MRIVLALVVGAALGFGGGWLAFAPPAKAPSAQTLTYEQMRTEFLRQIRTNEPDAEIDSASCQTRDGTGGDSYVCTLSGPNPYAFVLYDYVVSVHGRTVDYRRRFTR